MFKVEIVKGYSSYDHMAAECLRVAQEAVVGATTKRQAETRALRAVSAHMRATLGRSTA